MNKPIDLEEFSIQVDEISPDDARSLVRKRQHREYYRKRMENRLPDKRPMCSEKVGKWECLNRANHSFRGKPVCGIHKRMYEDHERRGYL